jgi:hypothetical protein
MSEYGTAVEWYWQGKTEGLREKPVPVPLCPTQIAHELTWKWTRASAVRSWRLTAWDMARHKLIGTRLVKKFPRLWNSKGQHHVHTSPPLDPIQNQMNSNHTLPKGCSNFFLLFFFLAVYNIYCGEGCLPQTQSVTWKKTSCRLLATAYSIYSQPFPVSPYLRTRCVVVTSDPLS